MGLYAYLKGLSQSEVARELAHDLCIPGHYHDPKSFVWTAKANDILRKVICANRRLIPRKTKHFTREVAWISGEIEE